MVAGNIVGIRLRRYAYLLGTVLALFGVFAFGLAFVIAVGESSLGMAALAGVVTLVALGFVAFAYQRTQTLEAQESQDGQRQALEFLAAFKQSAAASSGLAVHWRLHIYVILFAASSALGALMWLSLRDRSWAFAALVFVPFALCTKVLVSRLREREVLHVGTLGIDDRASFGLIRWEDIEQASLFESETKGVKTATLDIDVRNPETYSARLGIVNRWLFEHDPLRRCAIQLTAHVFDVPPRALFQVVRHFHERALPDGAISGSDTYYSVSASGPRMKAIHAELDGLYATVNDEAAILKGLPPGSRAAGEGGKRSLEAASRMSALAAELEQLLKTDEAGRCTRQEKATRATRGSMWILAAAVVLFVVFAFVKLVR